jgi:hypothetical protein
MLFLAVATAQKDAPPLLTGRGLGDYIRAGLGAYPIENTSGSDESLLTCAASWSSYNASQPSTTSNFGSYTIYPTTTIVNTTAIYGTGDVYTYSEGIPVARGTFTPTSTGNTVVFVTTNTSSYVTIPQTQTVTTPTCDFSASDCSRLYASYVSSLGLAPNATIPEITPVPTNSPQCPYYYYKPFTTCYASTTTGVTADCKLYGNSVELFYFPSQTDGAPEPTAPPTYVYAPGTTFTSPSIYLSFDYLSGLRNIPGTVVNFCKTCDQGGCREMAAGAADSTSIEGTTVAGRILSKCPRTLCGEHVLTTGSNGAGERVFHGVEVQRLRSISSHPYNRR